MTTEVADAAVRALGSDSVRTATEADRVDGVGPGVVVSPRTAEEAAAALAWASRERLSMVVRGSGTKDAWGYPPAAIDVLFSLERLNRIVEHAAGDLTVTVEAGARLADVDAVLAAHRQFLPLDPPTGHSGTIGGILATNDSGPLRHRFGTPSDLVLGVTVATTDGLVARSGGRVVKNVAGYDLARLLAGSHGTLAAIVSATFKLVPMPASTGTALVTADARTLERVIEATFAHQLEPLAVEVVAGHFRELAQPSLAVLFGSDAATVAGSIDALSAIATGEGGTFRVVAQHEEPRFWQVRGPTLLRHSTVLRLSWRPAALDAALDAVRQAFGPTPWILNGRAAVGAGHLGVDAADDEAKRAIEALRQSNALGHVVVVQGSRDLRASVGVWPPGPNGDLWTRLKAAWDPMATLGASRGPV